MKTLDDLAPGTPLLVVQGDWNEDDHPRDEDGKFTDAGGGRTAWSESSVVKGIYHLKDGGGAGDTIGAVHRSGSRWIALDKNGAVLSSHGTMGEAKAVVEAVAQLDDERPTRFFRR